LMNNTAAALAVRAHPRGGVPSADEEALKALRGAAAAAASDPELLSGPSSVSPDGVLLLPLGDAARVLDAILRVADSLRPMGATFCGAVADGAPSESASGHVESALIAAEAAASLALSGIETTDARERRVCLLLPEQDVVAAALAGLVLATYDDMTERQRQIIELTKESDTQQQVASHLDVTRQAVNQSLAAAGWPHLRRAEQAVREHLIARAGSSRRRG